MSTTNHVQRKSWTAWGDDAPIYLTSCITSTCQLLYPALIRILLILLVTGIPYLSRYCTLACWLQPSAVNPTLKFCYIYHLFFSNHLMPVSHKLISCDQDCMSYDNTRSQTWWKAMRIGGIRKDLIHRR